MMTLPAPPDPGLDFTFWKDVVLAITASVGAALGIYNFFAARKPVRPTLQARVTRRFTSERDAEFRIRILAFNDSATTNIVWTKVKLRWPWKARLADEETAWIKPTARGGSMVQRTVIDRALFTQRSMSKTLRIDYSSPGDRSSGSYWFFLLVPKSTRTVTMDCTFASTATGGYKGKRRIKVDLRLAANDGDD